MNEQYLFPIGVPIEHGDPCIRKARGNENSLANKPNKAWQQGAILAQLSKGNFTFKEIADRLQVPLHTISGRALELRTAGKIRRTGIKRANASEYEKI